MLRRIASIVATTAVAVGVLAATAPAANASTEESQFVSLTNSSRGSAGLRSYSVASDLVAVARRHSQEMAAKHTIYHNPNLASEVSGWQMVGENVGMGGSASSIHQAFMNSAPHRANILDHDYTQVGIGTAYDSQGVLYVTEVFRKPEGSTAAPAPAPAPRRTVTTTRPAYHPVATTTTSRPVTKPAAKPAVRHTAAKSSAAALAARLRAARRLAAHDTATGAVGLAVAYHDVLLTLSS